MNCLGGIVTSPTAGWTTGTLTSGSGLANITITAVGHYLLSFVIQLTGSGASASSGLNFVNQGGTYSFQSSAVPFVNGSPAIAGSGVFVISGNVPIIVTSSAIIQIVPQWTGVGGVTCVYGSSYYSAIRIG